MKSTANQIGKMCVHSLQLSDTTIWHSNEKQHPTAWQTLYGSGSFKNIEVSKPSTETNINGLRKSTNCVGVEKSIINIFDMLQ